MRDMEQSAPPPIQRAIDACNGNIAELARRIKRSPQIVAYWRRAVKGVPAEVAADIEEAVGGVVTRHELRPDVFGERAS